MRLDEVKNLNHEDNFIFAITVGDEGGFLHCAILYKYEGTIRTLEFTSEQKIEHSKTIGDLGNRGYVYVVYNQDTIIEPLALQVPSICELIKENNDSISFGIRFTETHFDRFNRLVFLNGDFGLTCATFVMAVFLRAGITLIDMSTWKTREEDVKWQKRVFEYYKHKNSIDPNDYSDELIKSYTENVGCFRYRPQEVAAATSAQSLPTNFTFCNEFGKRVEDAVAYGLDFYNATYS